MKKYLIVTDEGCYSDYGFHLSITDEETKDEIIKLFEQIKVKKEVLKSEYSWRSPDDVWDDEVKRLRYIQEVVGEPQFNDIEPFEWDWLEPNELIDSYKKIINNLK
jgi:hypothetical protein